MEGKLRDSLRLKFEPVAIFWTNHLPEKPKQFAKGKWGCVMMLYAQAAKGKTAAFDRETAGCWGGAVGLGFGNVYKQWPGGIDCFYRFLSTGNEGEPEGKAMLAKVGPWLRKESLEDIFLQAVRGSGHEVETTSNAGPNAGGGED